MTFAGAETAEKAAEQRDAATGINCCVVLLASWNLYSLWATVNAYFCGTKLDRMYMFVSTYIYTIIHTVTLRYISYPCTLNTYTHTSRDTCSYQIQAFKALEALYHRLVHLVLRLVTEQLQGESKVPKGAGNDQLEVGVVTRDR